MANDNACRVLVADDEFLARQRLEDLLSDREQVEIVDLVDNGRDAVEAIQNSGPDLVFLDVQMPDLTGLDVVEEVGPEEMPVTVFVTAYDEYALNAFEVAALDYLVKPFDDERFERAFSRAREMISLREVDEMKDRLLTLLQTESEPDAPEPEYLERIAVDKRGQIRVVPVADIDYIAADGPYAELHTHEQTFIVRERMKNLEDRLDPDRFFRIHRSVIVQLDRIESLLHSSGGDYAVRLHDGTRLRLSRSRRDELENRLGLR